MAKMMYLSLLLVYMVNSIVASPVAHSCGAGQLYYKVGCHTEAEHGMVLMITDRDQSSPVFSGNMLNWQNFREDLESLVCRCRNKADEVGASFFSIRNYAECWVGDDYERYSKSNSCIDEVFEHRSCTGPGYYQVGALCAGGAGSEYVYRVAQYAHLIPPTTNPTNAPPSSTNRTLTVHPSIPSTSRRPTTPSTPSNNTTGTPAGNQPQGNQPQGNEVSGTTMKFVVYKTNLVTQSEARNRCLSKKGKLAMVPSGQANKAIWSAMKKKGVTRAWIGINDRKKEGVYAGVKSYKNFYYKLKNRRGGRQKNCIIMQGGKWWNRECGKKVNAFVCQMKVESGGNV